MSSNFGLLPFLLQKLMLTVSDFDWSKKLPRYKWMNRGAEYWEKYAPRELRAKSALLTYKTFLSLVPISAYFILISRSADISVEQLGQNLSMILPGVSEDTLTETLGNSVVWIHSQTSILLIAIFASLWSVLSLVLCYDTIVASVCTKDRDATTSQSIMKLASRGLVAAFSLLMIVCIWDMVVHSFFPTLIPQIQTVAFWLVRFLIFWFVSFGAIYWLPLVFPRFKYAFSASAVIAVLFLLMQYVCSLFVDMMTQYNATFGSFGNIILLIIWLRLAWMLVLIGLSFCYVMQYGPVSKFYTQETTVRMTGLAMISVIRDTPGKEGFPIQDFCHKFSNLDDSQIKYYLTILEKAGLIDVSLKNQIIVPNSTIANLPITDFYNIIDDTVARKDESTVQNSDVLLVSDIELNITPLKEENR